MYLNEIKMIGYVGKDPITSAEGKKPFAAFDIAITKRYTPKGEGAEPVEKTQWYNIACYGNLAQIAGSLISKGAHVLITGELDTTEWTNKENGEVRQGVRIVANKILLLDKKNAAPATAEA